MLTIGLECQRPEPEPGLFLNDQNTYKSANNLFYCPVLDLRTATTQPVIVDLYMPKHYLLAFVLSVYHTVYSVIRCR